MRHYILHRRASSHEAAAAFRALYERRIAPTRKPAAKPSRAEQAAEFRAFVLTKISRLQPKWLTRIHSDVEDDYGSVGYARVRWAVARLVEDGKVVRTGEGYLLAVRRKV